ncbi:hypothetical protein E0H22_15650 [Rhodopseudomonas boonkerdii]|uniref:Mu transposase C-terminal domain-containing protein n=1 Tax=Rhodopseudomonas boonkerdii TaxID=475937 RepID=UPI001E2AABD2|nr:Mu transposase C-terminal domain-containing protein [Rhodopseudomonas boonkerdii]UGV26997.1 hypothetical protein E0H22_15650 [Rhodopseudomonas boonkerdii]
MSKANEVIRYDLGPLDRIIINDIASGLREFRVVSGDDHGYVLTAASGRDNRCEEFSHADIHALVKADRFSHDPRWYDEKKSMVRVRHGNINLFDLTETEQRQILKRHEIVELLLAAEKADKNFKRTDEYLGEVRTIIGGTLLQRNQARAAGDKKERCDQDFTMAGMPSTRTMRRWLRMYEESGCDVLSLRDGHHRSGNNYSNLAPTILALMEKHAAGYADRRRPTIHRQYEAMARELREINGSRESGAAPLVMPSPTTFRKVVKSIPAFDIHAGRFGIEAAKKKFAIVGAGLESVRAFQRMLADGHKMQIVTISEENGKEVKKRLMLHCAIDAATRCVTAVKLSETENKKTAVPLLRMAVSDKSRFAEAANCSSTWPMTARPVSVHTDSGSAWISTEFRTAVANLRATAEVAAVGVPWMRSHAERFFGTLDRCLLPSFSGRTFGSIQEKGDDDPTKSCSLLDDELGKAIVRYIVDVYHHTPHAGLLGLTPFQKWTELVDRYGVLPPPGKHEIRNIFGLRLERSLDQRGIRVAGVHYQSLKLQEHRRIVGDTTVNVMFDPEDIGAVSAWLGDGWVTVPAVHYDTFAGVHLDDWVEAARDLRRRNLLSAALTQNLVDEALRDIAALGNAAIARGNINGITTTAEELARAERETLFGFDIADVDAIAEGGVTANRDENGNRDRFANAIAVRGALLGPFPNDAAEGNTTASPVSTTPNRKPNIKLED